MDFKNRSAKDFSDDVYAIFFLLIFFIKHVVGTHFEIQVFLLFFQENRLTVHNKLYEKSKPTFY